MRLTTTLAAIFSSRLSKLRHESQAARQIHPRRIQAEQRFDGILTRAAQIEHRIRHLQRGGGALSEAVRSPSVNECAHRGRLMTTVRLFCGWITCGFRRRATGGEPTARCIRRDQSSLAFRAEFVTLGITAKMD